MFAVLSLVAIMTIVRDVSITLLKHAKSDCMILCDDTEHWALPGHDCCVQQMQVVKADCLQDRILTACACNKCSLHLMHLHFAALSATCIMMMVELQLDVV